MTSIDLPQYTHIDMPPQPIDLEPWSLINTPVFILGGGVQKNGELEPRSKLRAEVALRAILELGTPLAVLTGGIVRAGYSSEADLMYEFMCNRQGTDTTALIESRVRLEKNALTTRDNFAKGKELMEGYLEDRVGIVTCPFHSMRAIAAARSVLGKKIMIELVPTDYQPSRVEQIRELGARFATRIGLK